MNIQNMVKFLDDLAYHNTFTWMHEHQREYKEAKEIFLTLMQEYIFLLSKDSPTLLNINIRKNMGRLVRDTRFSNDKTPYDPAFKMHISPYGNAPIPCGVFVHIQPDNSYIGGGIFLSSFNEATNRIRHAIASNTNEFLSIVNDLEAHNIHILGMKLKRIPKGYDIEGKAAEYIKHKSWFIEVPISVSVDEKTMIKQMMDAYILINPLNTFLNNALGELRMTKK